MRASEMDKKLDQPKLLLPIDIRCPKDIPRIKWLAAQTPAVIELAKDLWKYIRPFCTEKSCRKMVAGKYEYQWKHHARSKKPRSCPAHYYLKMMFQWMNQQKHIFEMEQMRYERLIRHISEEGLDHPVLHSAFRDITIVTHVIDYLHDPLYYLTGIWAKAFSVFAHVFCQHFGTDRNEELSPEIKAFIETAFERFMRFVKGYHILSNRRLAPLDKRIKKIDFKGASSQYYPSASSTQLPRGESKSVAYDKSKLGGFRPSFLSSRPEASMVLTSDDLDNRASLLPSADKRRPDEPHLQQIAEKDDDKEIVSAIDPEAMSGAEYTAIADDEDNQKSRNGLDDSSNRFMEPSKVSKSSRPGEMFLSAGARDGEREFELAPLKEDELEP